MEIRTREISDRDICRYRSYVYRLDIALSSVHIFSWNERAIEKAERADFPFLFLARRDTKGNEKTHLGIATLITI